MSIRSSIASLTFLALLAGACGDGGATVAGEDAAAAGEEPVDASASDSEPTAAPEPSEAVEDAPLEETEPGAGPTQAEFHADAPEYISQFSPIDPGTHRVTAMGTEMSFTLEGDWWVQPNDPGFFVLSHPASVGPNDRDIVFVRATGLADPTAPHLDPDEMEGWALDDIDGWLDNLAEGITVTNRTSVMLGDREATRFDLRVEDDFTCGHRGCAGFVGVGDVGGKSFEKGVDFRIHWIDEPHAPIAIITGAGIAGQDFIDDAEAVLATLAFGEPQPHPIDPDVAIWEQGFPADVPAGRADFTPAGLSLELPEERFVFQNNGLVVVTLRVPAGVVFFRPVTDAGGNPITDADAIAEGLLADSAVNAVEVEPAPAIPYPARAFEVGKTGPTTFGLKWDEAPDRQWNVPEFGTVWIIETPEGVLFAAAESGGPEADADAYAVALELANTLLPTIESIPAG